MSAGSESCEHVSGHATYSTIVEDENDLIGLIAYSLYKSDKLAFVAQHKKDTGKAPDNGEMMAFCRTCNLPGPVSAYRTKASYLLSEMHESLMEDVVSGIDQKYKAQMLDELKKTHPFWSGVWQHLVASLMTTAIIAAAVLILYGQRIGFRALAGDVLGITSAKAIEKTP